MKRLLSRIGRWEHKWLCLLVVVILILHFAIIKIPDKPVFDEMHYITDARVIISGQETQRGEHPSLGKLFIVAGDYIFNGFKTPEEDIGAITSKSLGNSSDIDIVIDVSDATVFTKGQTIIIDKELMEITAIDIDLNQINVKRGLGGTTITYHEPQKQIFVFKDNALSWRFFSVILSTIGIILFYLICRNLALSRRTSLLATFLLAFENFTFLYSGMAMLDVSCVTFMLAAFWLYLRGNYPASGVLVALSALAKLNGALAIIAILLHWLIVRRNRIWQFIVLVVSAPVFFVGLMPVADFYPFHGWVNPLDRIITMLKGSASLTFTNVSGTYPEKPIEWIFRWDLTPYYFHPNYLAVVSYTVEFLIIPVLIYMLIRALGLDSKFWSAIIKVPQRVWLFARTLPRNTRLTRAKPLDGLGLSQTHVERLETSKTQRDAGIFGLCWFAATYLVWIPAVWITDRVTYPYYIYPTIGVICIGLGMGLAQLIHLFEARQSGKLKWAAISIVVIFLLAHLAFFALVSPLSYWWGTPTFRGLQS